MDGYWRSSAMVLLLALLGCAGRVFLDHASSDGITLHWYTREASIDIARAEAAEHCRRFEKHAVFVDEFEEQDITTAHFACR